MNFYTSNDISQVLCCHSLNVYYSSDWIFWSSCILWNARNDQTFWFYLSICHLLWSARLLINVRITLLARYQSPLIGVRPLWINWGWATRPILSVSSLRLNHLTITRIGGSKNWISRGEVMAKHLMSDSEFALHFSPTIVSALTWRFRHQIGFFCDKKGFD